MKRTKMTKLWLVFLCLIVALPFKLNTYADNTHEASALWMIFQEDAYTINHMNLALQNIEIKAKKDWSGQMAIIYSKTYDDMAVTNLINELYNENKAKIYKTLIKDYSNISKKFHDKLSYVSSQQDISNVTVSLTMLDDYISLLSSEPMATIDMEIQQANMISQSFDNSLQLDLSEIDSTLKERVNSLFRLKNIDIQEIIDELNEIKKDYEVQVEKDLEVKTESELIAYYQGLLQDFSSITVKRMGSNSQEVFIILDFNKLTDLDSGLQVGKQETLKLNEQQKKVLAKMQDLYVKSNSQIPEITATKNYLETVRTKTQSIMTISLEIDGLKLVQNYNSQLETSLKNEASANQGKELADLMIRLEEDLIAYKSISGKIKDDNDQVDKVLKLIEGWHNEVEDLGKNQLSKEALIQEFNEYQVFASSFDSKIPVEIRLSIEGKYLINKLSNNQVNTSENYYDNMVSSGDNAMRLLSDESEYMSLYQSNKVGLRGLGIGLILYLMILGMLVLFKREWFKNVLVLNVLLLITFAVFYPLVWVVGASFNGSQSLGAVGINPFPGKFTFIQYERLLYTTDYLKWFYNTFKIAIWNMLLTVTFAVSAAYVFSRFKFKGKKIGMMTMLIIQIFPSFSAMVAIYTLLANVKFLTFLTGEASLVNTHLGLILVYCAGQIPYNTWLIKGYFDTLPMSMDEAARIDGANNFQAFFKVILPLGRPIISFVAVTSFMAPWMDFIIPRLILKSTDKKTLAVGLFEMINGNANNNFTMFAAGAVLVAVPITLMYAYFQKYIVKGLASGAVKG